MNVTVVVPIGPDVAYRKYLAECIDSIKAQTMPVAEVLIVDDMADIHQDEVNGARIWKTPWNAGVSHAFNFGVALAKNNLVFMLGSDDRLEPWCIEDCVREYRKRKDKEGYYYVDVQYSDGRSQNLACHAAMVTKELWKLNGGFPIEAAVGASDTILISMMLAAKGKLGRLWHVESEKPPYWYRVHNRTDTAVRAPRFQGVIWGVRVEWTNNWEMALCKR